ncbi:MAG TPA: hypothetical protein ENJ55_06495, partial [Rhizobiales bacterium]|nr:hypothetical protein [Hyphomicrobiales bacterium]
MSEQEIKYEELAETLASHIFNHWRHDTGQMGLIFEHNFMSATQIASKILERLRIIKEIKEYPSLFSFTCEPMQFKKLARQNEKRGYDYKFLVTSIYMLMHYGNAKKLCDCLTRLDICRPAKPADYIPDFRGKINVFKLDDVEHD